MKILNRILAGIFLLVIIGGCGGVTLTVFIINPVSYVYPSYGFMGLGAMLCAYVCAAVFGWAAYRITKWSLKQFKQ